MKDKYNELRAAIKELERIESELNPLEEERANLIKERVDLITCIDSLLIFRDDERDEEERLKHLYGERWNRG